MQPDHTRTNSKPRRVWRVLILLWGLGATVHVATSAPPSLPKRNLVLEWRQIDEAAATPVPQTNQATTLSTHSLAAPGSATSQQLRVLNGDRTTIRVNQTVPVVWVQAGAVSAGDRQAAPSATVVHGLTWLETGRQLSFQPRWPGGEQPAVVEIRVESSGLEATQPQVSPGLAGNHPPSTSRQEIATTVLAPLGQWVTIARTGGEQPATPPGVWSTQAIKHAPRQLMQIRVIAP